jgi:hypothetical protein
MIGLTPDVTEVAVLGRGVLRLTFADGLTGEVEVLDRMRGPVFEDARTRTGSLTSRWIMRPGRWCGRAARTSLPPRSTSAFAPAPGLTRA